MSELTGGDGETLRLRATIAMKEDIGRFVTIQ